MTVLMLLLSKTHIAGILCMSLVVRCRGRSKLFMEVFWGGVSLAISRVEEGGGVRSDPVAPPPPPPPPPPNPPLRGKGLLIEGLVKTLLWDHAHFLVHPHPLFGTNQQAGGIPSFGNSLQKLLQFKASGCSCADPGKEHAHLWISHWDGVLLYIPVTTDDSSWGPLELCNLFSLSLSASAAPPT